MAKHCQRCNLNANIADGDDYYLRWSFNDLAGSAGTGVDRDEIGIADLRITPLAELDGDFDANDVVDGLDFLEWQIDPGIGLLSDWENNYGISVPIVSALAAVPEPNASLLVAMAAFIAISYRRS